MPEEGEEHQPQNDAIPAEGLETVPGKVAQKGADRDHRDDRGYGEADGGGLEADRSAAQERVPALDEVEQSRRAKRGEGEQK